MRIMLSTVLSFAGLGVALAVLIAALLLLRVRGQRLAAALYIGISAFYGVSLVNVLIRQNSGIVCAMTPGRTLLLYGGLLVLHMGFLWDAMKLLKREGGEAK